MKHTQNCLKKKKNQLTCAIRTQPSQQLKSYVSFNTHGTRVYLEYVSSPLKKERTELLMLWKRWQLSARSCPHAERGQI